MKRRVDAGGLARKLAGLPSLDRESLLERWRELYEAEPPAFISRPLLIRSIAYRLQEQVHGGLKPATRRFLEKAAADASAGQQVAVPATAVKPGTRLLREWHGVTHEVLVTDDGVQWNSKQYRSLSEVARAITGTRWSGPLFFGLRKGAA